MKGTESNRGIVSPWAFSVAERAGSLGAIRNPAGRNKGFHN
jgi:hypothetical protein